MSNAGTVLDVVDAYFHGDSSKDVSKLSDREIREFGEEVHRFYESAVFEKSPGAVYLGGWHGGAFSLAAPVAQETLRSLLYYESIVIHDPLAEYFRERSPRLPSLKPVRERSKRFSILPTVDGWATSNTIGNDRHDFGRVRLNLAVILERLEAMRPAIEAGIVLPRSVWPSVEARVHQLDSSMRHDLNDQGMQGTLAQLIEDGEPPLSWDHLRGASLVPEAGLFPGDERLLGQAPFLYLAKSLAIADSTGSRYAPYDASDWRIFEAKVAKTFDSGRDFVSGELIRSVGDHLLPEFSLPVKELVSIRKNEEAFEGWRAQMRTLNRDYGHLVGAELEIAISDSLASRIREVDAAMKSGSILQRARSGFTEVAVTAASGAAFAAAAPSPISAVAAAAAPAVSLWILKMLRPNNPRVGSEVLTTLRKQETRQRRG